MRIAVCLPDSILRRCFRSIDLDRLAAHDLVFTRHHTADQFAEEWLTLAHGADVLITGWGTPPITEEMLDGATRVKLIAHAAGSIRGLLPTSLFSRGIRVCTNNGVLAVGVAETTLGMIIGGLKAFDRCAQLTRAGKWKSNGFDLPGFIVRELFDIRIGLIGLSQVGRRVAEMLKAFEVEVLAYDPYASPEDEEQLNVRLVELDELMALSDVVSVHAPATPETHRMIGRAQLARMKNNALLINTARGGIIDQPALVDILQTQRISAILDVTDPDPPAADDPLRKMPNVVITPHIAGSVGNGCFRLGRNTVDQVLAFLKGQPIAGEVNEQVLQIMA